MSASSTSTSTPMTTLRSSISISVAAPFYIASSSTLSTQINETSLLLVLELSLIAASQREERLLHSRWLIFLSWFRNFAQQQQQQRDQGPKWRQKWKLPLVVATGDSMSNTLNVELARELHHKCLAVPDFTHFDKHEKEPPYSRTSLQSSFRIHMKIWASTNAAAAAAAATIDSPRRRVFNLSHKIPPFCLEFPSPS